MENHKAGFVNIIGNPNVGKSTLMNELIGEKLSIITPKAQTTRHRIFGIINSDDFQIVVSDTPGIINPHYSLHKSMMQFVDTALNDADIVIYVTDIYDDPEKNPVYIERIANTDIPTLVIINKIDLSTQEKIEQKVDQWKEIMPKANILPISAKFKLNIDMVLKYILHHLPESPAYFPKDELTDKTMRFIVSEIVREKIFLHYKKEIPYSVEVVVESYKETEKKVHIEVTIYTERDTQKRILIGHQGSMLKKVGVEARADIEAFIDKHVFLALHIKVDPDWRNNNQRLRSFGYIQ
ncbi:MAG: GTPase Era [Salinivirgaceae bacterium]|jgi:GTP-binding protein Era|nr:GTPase Era [Salinivirgaceae bacterium]MDD4747747.1 GTPase Era [Salinivirgaceae bacterium]MDY0280782.1 GTPase Era [Salinivirgaceae bacterium]